MTVPYETADPALMALEIAVPLRIAELAAQPHKQRAATIRWWAREAADAIGSQGDVLMFGSKKPGRAARVFNHLARGLAAGAYLPGGITFAGRHWQVQAPTRGVVPRQRHVETTDVIGGAL